MSSRRPPRSAATRAIESRRARAQAARAGLKSARSTATTIIALVASSSRWRAAGRAECLAHLVFDGLNVSTRSPSVCACYPEARLGEETRGVAAAFLRATAGRTLMSTRWSILVPPRRTADPPASTCAIAAPSKLPDEGDAAPRQRRRKRGAESVRLLRPSGARPLFRASPSSRARATPRSIVLDVFAEASPCHTCEVRRSIGLAARPQDRPRRLAPASATGRDGDHEASSPRPRRQPPPWVRGVLLQPRPAARGAAARGRRWRRELLVNAAGRGACSSGLAGAAPAVASLGHPVHSNSVAIIHTGETARRPIDSQICLTWIVGEAVLRLLAAAVRPIAGARWRAPRWACATSSPAAATKAARRLPLERPPVLRAWASPTDARSAADQRAERRAGRCLRRHAHTRRQPGRPQTRRAAAVGGRRHRLRTKSAGGKAKQREEHAARARACLPRRFSWPSQDAAAKAWLLRRRRFRSQRPLRRTRQRRCPRITAAERLEVTRRPHETRAIAEGRVSGTAVVSPIDLRLIERSRAERQEPR